MKFEVLKFLWMNELVELTFCIYIKRSVLSFHLKCALLPIILWKGGF